MTFNPRVSIIIPVYNGSDYLQEAIESALAQTYRNFEVIVVNDGSNDSGETEKKAVLFGDKIRYFSKENGGVASALNFGIKKMEGEYFSWLSHDDLYYPDKILKQIEFIAGLDEKDVFLFSDFEFIDRSNNHIGYQKIEKAYTEHPGLSIIFNQIHGCSVLTHKKTLENVNGFPEDKRTSQDYHTWLNIFNSKTKFYHIPHILIKSRIHENQGSAIMSEIFNQEIRGFYTRLIKELACNCTKDLYKIQNYFFNKDIELFRELNNSILDTHKGKLLLLFKVKVSVLFLRFKLIVRKVSKRLRKLFQQKTT